MKQGEKRILGGRPLQGASMSEQLFRQAGDADRLDRELENFTKGLDDAPTGFLRRPRVTTSFPADFPAEKVRDTVARSVPRRRSARRNCVGGTRIEGAGSVKARKIAPA